MRARRNVVVAGVVVAVVLFAACGGSGDSARSVMVSGHRMSNRTMTAGDVDVKVEPRQMNGSGAVFKVSMDTRTGPLDMDMQHGAHLTVDGRDWPMDQYTGDSPRGHHREGELRFRPGGPVSGMAQLMMDGFDQPVSMGWQMGSSAGSGGPMHT